MLRFRTGVLAAVLAAAMAGIHPLAAEEPTRITLVQQHPLVSVGEEVFMIAVPKHLGYFRAEGLEVTLQNAAGGGAAVQVLESGSAEFATTVPEAIMKAREQGGDPAGFYALRRRNGSKIAVLPQSPIRELADLKGKTVGGLSWGAGGAPILVHMLSDIGIGAGDYTRVTVGTGAAAASALANRQIDALVLWDAMFAAFENNGMSLRYIEMPIQDRMGALTLTTTDRMIAANPKAVAGLCRAVNEGLHFTRTNTPAAVAIFFDEFPAARPANVPLRKALADGVHIMETWLQVADGDLPYGAPAGELRAANWDFSQDFYAAEGMLKGTTPARDAYTNRFLAACNDFDHDAVAAAAKAYPVP